MNLIAANYESPSGIDVVDAMDALSVEKRNSINTKYKKDDI